MQQRESSAHTAGAQTTTLKHAEKPRTMFTAPQTARSQQDITPQQHHHHCPEQLQQELTHHSQAQQTIDHCLRISSRMSDQEPAPQSIPHLMVHHQHPQII